MSAYAIKPFNTSSLENPSGQLKAHKAATELKALHNQAWKGVVIKSLLALIGIAAAVAMVAISLVSYGIGLFILSLYVLHDCEKDRKRINRLFTTAKTALTQI